MILAADPGKMTGWATYDPDTGIWVSDQSPLQEFLVRADASLTGGWAVVSEKFSISQRTVTAASDAHWAMKGNGVLEYFCETRGLPFTLQTPAEAKRFATDDKLKTLGFYRATKGGHANDASRHLLTYLVRKAKDQPALRELLKPLLSE